MPTEHEFDNIVRALYEAAENPECWLSAMTSVRAWTESFAAHYLIWDKQRNTPLFSVVDGGYSSGDQATYAQYYGKIDPRLSIANRDPVGEIFNCSQHFYQDYVDKSEFYNDFLIPAGGRYVAIAKLAETSMLSVVIGLHRSVGQGAFDSQQIRPLAQLLPHLAQATKIQLRLQALKERGWVAESALNDMGFGVIVVDCICRPVMMNRMAQVTLDRGDGLNGGIAGQPLAAVATGDTARLHGLVAGRHGPIGAVQIGRSSAHAPYHVLVQRLPSLTERTLGLHEQLALLVIIDPEDEPLVPARVMRDLFGLTVAEAELASALARGARLDEIAEQRQVQLSTVRAQLKSIMNKTDTDRQSSLVRLLVRLSIGIGSPGVASPPL
jgi:DNA-binding CsgD family transcriptional regulator